VADHRRVDDTHPPTAGPSQVADGVIAAPGAAGDGKPAYLLVTKAVSMQGHMISTKLVSRHSARGFLSMIRNDQ
jgi:hypothetical protein